MEENSSKNTLMPLWKALDYACSTLGKNETVWRMERNPQDRDIIQTKLKEMGISHVKPLTTKYTEGTISLPLYAGDGIVVKIIPTNYHDETRPIFQLPPITSEIVEADSYNRYVIATYPWLPDGNVTQSDVTILNAKMSDVGLTIAKNDDHPRNFHALPDKENTVVSIDADLYRSAKNGKKTEPELKEKWQKYILSTVKV